MKENDKKLLRLPSMDVIRVRPTLVSHSKYFLRFQAFKWPYKNMCDPFNWNRLCKINVICFACGNFSWYLFIFSCLLSILLRNFFFVQYKERGARNENPKVKSVSFRHTSQCRYVKYENKTILFRKLYSIVLAYRLRICTITFIEIIYIMIVYFWTRDLWSRVYFCC